MSKVIEQPAAPQQPEEEWILDRAMPEEFAVEEGQQPQPIEAPVPPAAPPAPGTLPGQGFQYTTQTGHTFRGNTPEEVLKQMEQAVIRSATMAANAQELDRARTSMSGQTTYERGGTRQPEEPAEEFDQGKYFKLLAESKPREAHDYMMRTAYGIEDLGTKVRTSYSVAQKTQDRFEVADFMTNNLDFPAGDFAAEQLLLRLNREGAPVTRWNLETAKGQLYRENVIQPVAVATAGTSSDNGSTIPSAPPPAPPASRGAGAPPPPKNNAGFETGDRELSEAELYAMPVEKHKEYLQKRGYKV